MLKLLTETDGVSGNEGAVAKLIKSLIEPYCDDIVIDNMGNVICRKNGRTGNKTVLLCAHTDEVGFIVNQITDDGYIKFLTVGGIETKILLSQKVRKGDVKGVISLKAVHLTEKEEREQIPKEEELYIDIGASSKEEAEKYVKKGDYFAFDSEFIQQGDMIKAKALDDRVGCAMLIEVLKMDLDCNIICAFVTCEEVGHLGAIAALENIKADYALVREGTSCNDMAGVPDEKRVTRFGGGIAISVMDYGSVASQSLAQKLIATADKNGVKWQYKASVRGGNDARVVSTSGGGIETVSLSVPCKYIHSPISVMNKNDFDSGLMLVAKFLEVAEVI